MPEWLVGIKPLMTICLLLISKQHVTVNSAYALTPDVEDETKEELYSKLGQILSPVTKQKR